MLTVSHATEVFLVAIKCADKSTWIELMVY